MSLCVVFPSGGFNDPDEDAETVGCQIRADEVRHTNTPDFVFYRLCEVKEIMSKTVNVSSMVCQIDP